MKTTDFSPAEIRKAIEAVERKMRNSRELSIEAETVSLREAHTKSHLLYQTRLNELQLLLTEVLNETK